MDAPQRFLAACARQPVDRTPVWMMRQAGRYLPEYRAVRERVDFLTLCKTPELAAQVSLQPIERFGMDACIVFSDILIPVEAMGASVAFGDGGPVLERPVRGMADVDRLGVPDPEVATPFVMQALRLTRRALDGRAALVGFTGAPYTLASYMIEGGGSKTFATTKRLMYEEPQTLHALLAKLAETVAAYAAAQVAAGAQAVQVFDTWAGELEPRAYEHFAMPYQTAVIERIRSCGVPAILYVNGCAGVLEMMRRTGADVLSVDWRVTLAQARGRAGFGVALQGNVDPAILLTTPQLVTAAAHAAMHDAGPIGHILNLGHGILPATPPECAAAFVSAPTTLGA
jgi:uroporphyrinogen decarboxylase